MTTSPRATRALAAAIAAVLVLAGASVQLVGSADGDGDVQVVAGRRSAAPAAPPAAAPAADWDQAEPEPEPAAAAAPAAGAPAAAPRPAASPARPSPARPAAKRASGSSAFGPDAPETVVIAHQVGRTEWRATSNGVALLVRIDRAAPKAGEAVGFHVEATSGDRPCCGFTLLFGDGGRYEHQTSRSCPGGGPAGPGTVAVDLTHTYNKAGRWPFLLSVHTGSCDVEATYAGMRSSLDVAPGRSTSQGPSLPTIQVADMRSPNGEPDPNVVKANGRARDEDGWIAGFTIDWGDGSPTEAFGGDPMGCRPSASGWPAASQASTPTNPPPQHRYAAPGTYTVTITARSTGCGGGDEQRASGTFTWHVPG